MFADNNLNHDAAAAVCRGGSSYRRNFIMRRMILGLCCLALAATPAWAQSSIKDGAIVQVNLRHGGNCNDTCCAPKVCTSVPTTIKHTTTCFSSKCIEYCLPKCALGGHGCNTCADNCGPVRTKHVLMLKRVTTECPGTKCEVTLAPAGCAQPCATVAPRPGVETIPVQPMKK
jgi:hypothetical protein